MFKPIVAIICLLLFGQTVHGTCNVNAKVPAGRTFATTHGHGQWREYGSIQAVPELDNDDGQSAQVWREDNGASFAYFVEPGEDFWRFTRYCFDSNGQLREVGFEIRTAWGWGYRLEGSVARTEVQVKSSQFFNTESGKAISKPDGANDIPDALKPLLYQSPSNFPFANLLKRSPPAARR